VGAQKIDVFYRPDFVSADRDKPIGMDQLCLTVAADSIQTASMWSYVSRS